MISPTFFKNHSTTKFFLSGQQPVPINWHLLFIFYWHICSCSTFRFLQAEIRKYVLATILTHLLLAHLQLLPLRYNFYMWKSENNTNVRPARAQVHVVPHILNGKTGTSNQTGITYTSRLIWNRLGLKYM